MEKHGQNMNGKTWRHARTHAPNSGYVKVPNKHGLARCSQYCHKSCLYATSLFPSIGDFRVAFCLCFKASPSAKPFIWIFVLFTCK